MAPEQDCEREALSLAEIIVKFHHTRKGKQKLWSHIMAQEQDYAGEAFSLAEGISGSRTQCPFSVNPVIWRTLLIAREKLK